MTTFFNPFSLLQPESPSEDVVRRAKKQLLAQIELQEGAFERCGRTWMRSEALGLLELLDQPAHRAFYWALYQEFSDLNRFLETNNRQLIVSDTSPDLPIFLPADLRAFIAAPLAASLGVALLEVFGLSDPRLLKRMLARIKMLCPERSEAAFHAVESHLLALMREAKEVESRISASESVDIKSVWARWRPQLNPEAINALPPLLQTMRNELGYTLRGVAYATYTELSDYNTAWEIVQCAAAFHLTGTDRDRVDNTYTEIKDAYGNRQGENPWWMLKTSMQNWVRTFAQLLTDLHSGACSPDNALEALRTLPRAASINQAPSDFEQLRTDLLASLTEIARFCLEKNHAQGAVDFIEYAVQIQAHPEFQAQAQLLQHAIRRKFPQQTASNSRQTSNQPQGNRAYVSSSGGDGIRLMWMVGLVITLAFSLYHLVRAIL